VLIRSKRSWEIPEAQATPEHVFLNRRVLLASGAAWLGVGLIGGTAPTVAQADDPTRDLYPARRNETFRLDRPVTEERYAADYNNFYEFGSSKSVAAAARALRTRPWTVSVDGLVEAPLTIGIDDLIRRMPLEERLYRRRCVEAWAIAVPWTGFPMRALLDLAKPLGLVRHVVMKTFQDRSIASGQRQTWYPWPYTEGLTLSEAANDLAFLVTGVYGKPLANQFGAPLRLAVP
jgi:methionine sulfoxide reductase catalytic subunit